jgi:hypothetical protein
MQNEMNIRVNGGSLALLEAIDIEQLIVVQTTQRIMRIAENESRTAKQVDLTFSRNYIKLSVRR